MAIDGINPRVAASGWITALRNIRHNPIPDYWHRADLRKVIRTPWYKNSLFILSLLFSLLLTGAVVYYGWRILSVSAGGQPAVYQSLSVVTATSILTLGATLFGLLWVANRLFQLAQVALGFLEISTLQSRRQSIDDLLATSRLSGQDLVAGLGLYSIRLMAPPLVFVAAAQVLVEPLQALSLALVSGNPALLSSLYSVGMLNVLGLGLRIVLSGLLATLILTFILATLGLGERLGLLPVVGALVHIVMQFLLFAGGIAVIMIDIDFTDIDLPVYTLLGLGLPLLLVLILLMYIARRYEGIRRMLAWALPLVLLAFAAGLYANEVLTGGYMEGFNTLSMCGLWSLQGITIVSPLNLNPVLYGAGSITGFETAIVSWFNWLLSLLVQLGLLLVCAEFARDAVIRRKWLAGGAQ